MSKDVSKSLDPAQGLKNVAFLCKNLVPCLIEHDQLDIDHATSKNYTYNICGIEENCKNKVGTMIIVLAHKMKRSKYEELLIH